LGLVFLIISLLAYFQQGYADGKWWTTDYILSLTIPAGVTLAFFWFGCVPKLLEYSESEITISTLLGKATYPWDLLYCYGKGRGVLVIQFTGDQQPYQIYAGAYASRDVSELVKLMKERFPERERAFPAFGPWMRPKGHK